MRTAPPALVLSLCFLASACGPDDGPARVGADGLLSIIDFGKAHEDGDYFVTEPDDQSPFGEVTRVEGGLTWLYVEREVRVAEGDWKVDWRLALPADRELDALLRVQPEPGCGEEVGMTATASGLGEETWMVIPEQGFHFSVPGTCVVKISLLDETSSKRGWGLDWARILPAD